MFVPLILYFSERFEGQSRSFYRKLHGLYFPNGDPWLQGMLEIFLPVGTNYKREDIVNAVASSLNITVFEQTEPIVNKHRWGGLYSGTGLCALQQNLWGLGRELFIRFSKAVASRKVSRKVELSVEVSELMS